MLKTTTEHLDVLIVGAGLSGIDAGYRLQTGAPDRRYAILEGRDAIGGTWDLFRYPGIRSDSDMATLGFPFRPWRGERSIVDGMEIRDYIVDTARHYGIDRHIRFGHQVTGVDWSSDDARWTVSVTTAEGPQTLTCDFLFLCSGYYDYEQGHAPTWPGTDEFAGRIVHPQFWPDDLDTAGKRVVVIGSGATAVTLVPSLAETAAHVTMLQRSPSYIVSRPGSDRLAIKIRRVLPRRLADGVNRWRNILFSIVTYRLARRRPEKMRALLRSALVKELGPDFEVDRHFNPSYDPWDQRLCLVPDGDLFARLRDGRASIVTDHIERFTPTGITLRSGEELPADIVVSATGLNVKMMGGAVLSVDGEAVDVPQRLIYKGAMIEGVPNFAFAFGYTNASWTLKCDLTSRFVVRLLRYMRRHGVASAVPRVKGDETERMPLLDFSSGYIQRAAAIMPRQGTREPWRVHQNYARDLLSFRLGRINDGVLRFAKRAKQKVAA